MASIIVGIGRNVGSAPMRAARWSDYRRSVGRAIRDNGGSVVAAVTGPSSSAGWADEDACWFAAEVPDYALAELKDDLRVLCGRFGQDAIALTVGTVDLVSPAALVTS